MFNKILAAIDGSPASEKVLAAAVDLATRYQAELIALSVAEMPEVVAMVDEVDELRQSADDYFRKIGEGAVGYARSHGVKLQHMVVRGHAADGIVSLRRGRGRGPDRPRSAGALAHCAILPG